MVGKIASIGFRATVAAFAVVLLVTGIPAVCQETSIWPARQGMSIPVPGKDTSILEASRETSMQAPSKDVGIHAAIRAARPGPGMRAADGSQDYTLWDFGYGQDGTQPEAGLVADSKGNLYGTTVSGGRYGHGTVFELEYDGAGEYVEIILWDFGAIKNDGIIPVGGLTFDPFGNLWGTTSAGGKYGNGTVFELGHQIGGNWGYEIQYNFGGYEGDGNDPMSGLVVDSAGNLYGTTWEGGAYNFGIVFMLYFNEYGQWFENTLYNFAEGRNPVGSLLLYEDFLGVILYGTTSAGAFGDGTVFLVSGDGSNYTTLHTFKGGNDGSVPYGGVILVRDALYGTTLSGGAHDLGTVFEILPPDRERVLHSFAGDNDGAKPAASLVYYNGSLYGTTEGGGAKNQGTVFRLSPAGGDDTVIYSFQGLPANDGSFPTSNLVPCNNGLYVFCGTTLFGGANGDGTAFAIDP